MSKRLTTRRGMLRIARRAQDMFFNDYAYYFPPPNPDTNLDDYGQPKTGAVESGQVGPVRCSFVDSTTEARKWVGDDDIQHIDALIRLDRSVTPEKGGRFVLAGRFNELDAYVDATYEVVNVRDRDVYGFVCGLRRASI